MAKFYQHMQPGENLGKITRLKYIDDISDDELIIYVFEDKSKCSEDYIAEINSLDAFNGNYVMTELTDPLNVWVFDTKEINLNKTRKVIADDGQEYELPEPGIGINGEHVSLTLSADGTPITNSNASLEGKRTTATPPRVIKNKVVEAKENYLLSLHPELLNEKKSSIDKNLLSSSIKKSTQQNVNKVDNYVNTVHNIKSNTTNSIIETVKQVTLNLDNICNNKEYDSIEIILNGDKRILTIDEFVDMFTTPEPEHKIVKEIEHSNENTVIPVNNDEDILITNMIDKSKKEECSIGVEINLSLPPISVYKTIKDVYPDGLSDNFITSITHRIDTNSLKNALSLGLKDYYENNVDK